MRETFYETLYTGTAKNIDRDLASFIKQKEQVFSRETTSATKK